MRFTVADVANLVGGEIRGEAELELSGISSLTEAGPGDISFMANSSYVALLSDSKASAVLVPQVQDDIDTTQIIVSNPDYAFAQVVTAFWPQPRAMSPGVHPSAIIGNEVEIGENCTIGPYAVIGDGTIIGDNCTVYSHVFIGSDVRMGNDCLLYPQVTIRENCKLGDRVILHAGSVIGADGFGYASLEGVHHKIPQVGIVELGDDVEIGACSTIDRSRFGVTSIGEGTKIDNHVMVAHNVEIGKHCIVVGQTGVAGSTRIGDHVTLAAQTGVAGHLKIGDGAVIAARSGVTKSLPERAVVMGFPAQDMRTQKSREIALRRLPRTNDTVRELEHALDELRAEVAELRQQVKKQ